MGREDHLPRLRCNSRSVNPETQAEVRSADRQINAGIFICLFTVFIGWLGYAYRNESSPPYRGPMFPPLFVLVFCVGLYLFFRGLWRLRKMGERPPK